MRRTLAALLLAGVALVAGAGPALAHNVLVSSDPKDGATLETGPGQVKLVFDQPVQQSAGETNLNTVTITGPDGKHYPAEKAKVDGTAVSAVIGALGPAGQYTIGYRILSADGHPVSGSVKFTVTTAGTGTPAPAPTSAAAAPAGDGGGSGDGGMPVWPWIVGAVVLLGAGVAVAVRLGRS
ncbi:copper resistance CopC family protein [Streptoalloteichus tenebrarius]|uniref:copper resistance CopC family protein n=1 Tax=Streptoalloteichus tenebrarius (strain ATCC 17920 / DSM 40477 / JCM 4838 / CBS 697.72 / NBRC 16177 / NCIMB 11028 / NRRL B-12390 / A12253. 1 / ISP 5477) TaxID=1933 RepID=UPI0020A50224|nr:copper resistance CopC family protein [Streptoalloteichus tenebrarius]